MLVPDTISVPGTTTIFDKYLPSPIKKFALAAFPRAALSLIKFPKIVNDVNVPTLVMLGCALVVNVPVKKLAVAVLPKLELPATLKLANVPTLVIFGCEPVVNVPVKKLAVAVLPKLALLEFKLPLTVAPVPDTTTILAFPEALRFIFPLAAGMFIFELPLASIPTKLPDTVFPTTVKLLKLPTLVIFG